ncbi:MAG: hypothetical protein LBE91_09655 [Tannerella sp.]|jgi:hypothetical protein|nr:hypothetical protein [Tannerella sp.]
MKYDLKDMTFLIPVRLDSIVRLENLLLTVELIESNFETNITILEADRYNNGLIEKLCYYTKYEFVEDKDMVFHRTKHINRMALASETPYLAIWDTDVIMQPSQIMAAIEKLREGYEIAFPYDGDFLDISFIIRDLYVKNPEMEILVRNKDKMLFLYGKEMKGGAIMVNKDAYIKSGMDNERYYGWGPEDFERYERWKVLEYRIFRSEGYLFHLSHGRGSNSRFRSMEQMTATNSELLKTRMSSKEELLKTKNTGKL